MSKHTQEPWIPAKGERLMYAERERVAALMRRALAKLEGK